jgi:hypothetical protein
MTNEQPTDYDRVIAHLKRDIESETDHAERIMLAADLAELLDMYTHWARVFTRDTTRPGNPFNLAVLGWVGLDTKRRLPYVFNALGLGRLG